MTVDGLQLPHLTWPHPVNVALHRIEIGADFGIAQPAHSKSICIDVHHDAAARFILVVSESLDKAAVNLR